MRKLQIALYTCITNGYEVTLPAAPKFNSEHKNFMFCDFDIPDSLGWKTRELAHPDSLVRPDLINRYHKFFAHRILSNFDVSIYVDGNILVYGDPTEMIRGFLDSGAPIGLSRHPQRKSIADELEACKTLGKFKFDDHERASAQVSKYLSDESFSDDKLFYGGVIFRNHQHKALLDSTMDAWWYEVITNTGRDQISLPYVLQKNKIIPFDLGINIQRNPHFYRFSHHKPISKFKLAKRKFYSLFRHASISK